MIIVGIDFSIVCPCACYIDTDLSASFDTCMVKYISSKKNEIREWNVGSAVCIGEAHREYECQEERVTNIAVHLLAPVAVAVERGTEIKVYLEGYSMGSKGRVFDIAESAGMLKHFMWTSGIKYQLVPPTVVKKFATGKGNSDKNQMYDAFLKETGANLMVSMFPGRDRKKVSSPVSDIVDAYYIAKYGVSVELQSISKA